MILRFVLGVGRPRPARRGTAPAASTTTRCDAGGGDEVLLDLLGLALAQQPVVDEHTGQLVADGPLDQRRGDRGVDAAGQAADRPRSSPTCSRIGATCSSTTLCGRPVGLDAGAVVEEVLEHALAVLGVHHLGVVLHAGQPPLVVLERGDRRVRRWTR